MRKQCKTCKKEKDTELFRSYRQTCYDCEKEKAAERARLKATELAIKRKEKQEQINKRRRELYKEEPERFREVSREWQRKHKGQVQERLNNLYNEKKRIVSKAKSVPCADCGKLFPPECMDFDHVKGNKITNIGKMMCRPFSIETFLKEIAKCEVVCSNCHRIRTMVRRLPSSLKKGGAETES